MAKRVWVLVHSPLLGPFSWRPVADVLTERGHPVVVPDGSAALREGPPYNARFVDRVAAAVDSAVDDAPVVLVGHSRAGPMLPAIAEAAAVRVDALILVDARPPHPGEPAMAHMPPEAAERLRALAVNGMLPPWHAWFGPGMLTDLLPDDGLRAAFLADAASVPFGLYLEPASPAVWRGPLGYLLLSEAYRADAETARIRDTAVVMELPGHHLSTLTAPARTADALERLVTIMLAA